MIFQTNVLQDNTKQDAGQRENKPHITKINKPGVLLHTLNPRTQKAVEGGSLLVQGQPSLQSELQDSLDYTETLSEKDKIIIIRITTIIKVIRELRR